MGNSLIGEGHAMKHYVNHVIQSLNSPWAKPERTRFEEGWSKTEEFPSWEEKVDQVKCKITCDGEKWTTTHRT